MWWILQPRYCYVTIALLRAFNYDTPPLYLTTTLNTTAFKITKSHVDAIVAFTTPEEAEAALAALHLDSSSDDDDDDAPKAKTKTKKREKLKKANLGNFSQFRNKTFNPARHAKKDKDAEEEED
jgi:hypothetical protein